MPRTCPSSALRLWLGCGLVWSAGLSGVGPSAANPPEEPTPSPLTALLRRETTTLATLDSLARWMLQIEEELQEARDHQLQLDYRMTEATRRYAALSERTQRHRVHLIRRLRSLYKMSRGGVFRLLVEAVDHQDLSLRLSAASLILKRDLRELQIYQHELTALHHEQTALQKQRQQTAQHLLVLQRKEQRMTELRAEQARQLHQIKASRKSQLRLAAELTEQQRMLLTRLAQQAEPHPAQNDFLVWRGRLPLPVRATGQSPYGQITDPLHHLEIARHGITFEVQDRSEVLLVAPGTVELAGPLPGFGLLVLINHGQSYYTLYAFLARVEVKVGNPLRQGARLGHSGLDPLTGHPALYFELRHKERPLDPSLWFSAGKRPGIDHHASAQ
jgi:murein hydrolase activator